MQTIEIARALKDKDLFSTLTPADQETVLAAGGVGTSDITDESLESVSSGLEGGAHVAYTGSTTQIGRGEGAQNTTLVICHC